MDKESDLQHLKRVSRIKHVILQKYLPPWASILGSRNSLLTYCDCFAGPGQYEYEGRHVDGSPLIAVRAAIDFLVNRPGNRLNLILIDDDPGQVRRLKVGLEKLGDQPNGLNVQVKHTNSHAAISELLKDLPSHSPAFFLIDPYGHPLPMPRLNQILKRNKTELLLNLMWFRINMDLSNPTVESRLTDLFGGDDWKNQSFLGLTGRQREQKFFEYFTSKMECKYLLPFRVRYDAEDLRGGDRTKYYLLHASNHVRAALLMKEVMWPLGDEEGTFDYSGESQGVLFSMTPTERELEQFLRQNFGGRTITFDGLREETWALPFIERQYRSVIRGMEGKLVLITRVTSKKSGVSGFDRLRFL